jgi:hypothetical protein
VAIVVSGRRRARADLVVLSFVLVYVLSLLPIQAHFDRYVLPLVPVLAVLAGRSRLLVPLAVLACAVPLWWSIDDAASLTGRDHRLDAAAWIDEAVPADDAIAADPSTLPLTGRPVVRLELPGPHRPFDPRRELVALHAEGVRWLVVSGSVTDRVLAAPAEYPREARFYRSLQGLRPAFAAPASGPTRPWLRVYRVYP